MRNDGERGGRGGGKKKRRSCSNRNNASCNILPSTVPPSLPPSLADRLLGACQGLVWCCYTASPRVAGRRPVETGHPGVSSTPGIDSVLCWPYLPCPLPSTPNPPPSQTFPGPLPPRVMPLQCGTAGTCWAQPRHPPSKPRLLQCGRAGIFAPKHFSLPGPLLKTEDPLNK